MDGWMDGCARQKLPRCVGHGLQSNDEIQQDTTHVRLFLIFTCSSLLLEIKIPVMWYSFSTPQCHVTSPTPGLKERNSHTWFIHASLFMFCAIFLGFHCRKDLKFRVHAVFDNVSKSDTLVKPRNLQKTNQTVSERHGGRSEQSAREREHIGRTQLEQMSLYLSALSGVLHGFGQIQQW